MISRHKREERPLRGKGNARGNRKMRRSLVKSRTRTLANFENWSRQAEGITILMG